MATAEEALGAKTPLASDLAAGVDALSLVQEITFTRYIRLVLPLDGYVFWVKSDLVAQSAIYNKGTIGQIAYNQSPRVKVAASTLIAKGSLHYATDVRQEEAETYAANRVVFTSEQEVQDLNNVAPGTLWIGEFDGVRFAFSSRSSFYRQADLFHYVGFAVYADMATQIVDSMVGFNPGLVVSNSLPAWLALNGYNPPYGFGNPSLVLYPSFLAPDNIEPPFAAVHVYPESTKGMAMAPRIDPGSSTHSQLCSERVRVTLWGTRNDQALDFMDCVNQYSLTTSAFGLMGIPVVRDEKRTQSELLTIAMKKTIDFDISYLQTRMNDIAQQIIQQSFVNYYVAPG